MKRLFIPALLLSCVFVGNDMQAACRSCSKRQCSTCTKRSCKSCTRKPGCKTCTGNACTIVAASNVTK